MTREIKFRAWDTVNKIMAEVIAIEWAEGGSVYCRNPKNQNTGHLSMVDDGRFVKLMQYTGLKDKNGKEIYEGDIYKNGANQIQVVSFDTNKSTSSGHGDCTFQVGITLLSGYGNEVDNIEVIGNIHENPELLENNNG